MAKGKRVGGRREGSGRPGLPGGRVTLLVSVDRSRTPPTRGVTITQPHWSAIEAFKDQKNLKTPSEALRRIIEQATGIDEPIDERACPVCKTRMRLGKPHRCENGDVYVAEEVA